MRPSALVLAAAVAGGALLPTLPAAAATKPRHVAIVIAGKGVACVPWHSGITGDEVLNDVATVRYRPSDGLITQIDGTPRNNRADERHYWSYWHNTGAGWTYGTTGASAYHPAAGNVEGWRFVNGSPSPTPPPTRSYASICHDTVASSPPAAPSPSRTAASSAPTRTRTRTATASAATNLPAAPLPSTTHATVSLSRSAAPTSSTPSRVPPTTASSAPSSKRAAALPTLHVRAADATPKRAEQGSALPTVAVAAIVVLLGGTGAYAARRRRHRP